MISTSDDLNWLKACDWKTKQKIWHNGGRDLFPYLKSHPKYIQNAWMHIYGEEHFYTGVCKVCPSFVSYLKQCELPCCYFQRWANPLVVASLETWIHEIKGIWFFATIGFTSIITLMFIQVSYLKWVGLWCLDITLILPNTCNQWLYLYIKHISNRVVKSWTWSCLLFYK